MKIKHLIIILAFLVSPLVVIDAHGQNTNLNSLSSRFNFDIRNLSIDSVKDFFLKLQNDIVYGTSFYDLVGFAIGMVIYGIFIYHFYRFLAKRDLFNIKLAKRLSSGENITKAASVFAFIVTNFFIYPIVIFVWFIIYSLFMFFLAQGLDAATVFLVVSALVIAVRIAAYYAEDLAKDLAKLLPFAMLGFFLLSPKFFTIDDLISRLNEFPSFIENIAVFLIFAIVVETFLSIAYLIRQKIKPSSDVKLEEKIEEVVEEKVKDKIKKIEEKHEDLKEELDEKRENLKEEFQEKHQDLKEELENNNKNKK